MKPDAFIILSPGFAAAENDSTCLTSQQAFVKLLQAMYGDMEIIVLALQYPFSKTAYVWNGCTIIPFGGREKGRLSRLLVWRKVWTTMQRIRRQKNIIGLLSFWYGECALLGHSFGSRYHIAHHCWMLGQDAKPDNKYVSLSKLPAGSLIAMSDFLADEFYRNYAVRPKHVVTNGIDTSAFPENMPPKDIDILGVGSLIPLKQYELFISQVERLQKILPGIKAVIVGKGPEEEQLRSLTSEKKLEQYITLTGELPHTDTLQLMQRSRILLHTSRYEGFSTVALEALYAGCTVISFVQPMHAAIGNWHIAKDEASMQELLLQHIQDTSGKRVLAFSMQDSVTQIMALYQRSRLAAIV